MTIDENSMCTLWPCLQPGSLEHLAYASMNFEDICKLGEVLLMSHLIVEQENKERKERLLLLFPGVVVMLSVTHDPTGYVYEGKYPTSGMRVESLDVPCQTDEDDDSADDMADSQSSMEYQFIMCTDRQITVICSTRKERTRWVEALQDQAKHGPVYIPTKPQSLQISTSQPAISQLSQAKTAQVLPFKPPKSSWTISRLRPCPPVRPPLFAKEDPGTRSPRTGRKTPYATLRKKPVDRSSSEDDGLWCKKLDEGRTLEDDSILLKVIEAYCTSAKTRHTVNSSLLESPQVLIAEEEKIIVEEIKGDQIVVEEKSLVDTVYLLRDTVNELKQEQILLKKELEEEKLCRKKLETIVKKTLRSMADTASIHTLPENNSVSS